MPYKDPADQTEYQRLRNLRIRREWLDRHGPCRKCGSWDNLEVDHVDRSQKVSHKVWTWSTERREAELSKCQPLCKLCHRDKTKKELKRPIRHGTASAYKRGCRCTDCKTWRREKRRQEIGYYGGIGRAI